MKIKNYEKATELLKSQKQLEKLHRIFCVPYPHIFAPLKKLLFFNNDVEICFISFDEKTQKELKAAIRQVIDKRLKEIEEEIENIKAEDNASSV